jgi:hypothetical protein
MSTKTSPQFTTDAGVPPQRQRTRFSLWEALFDECRAYMGEWRRTNQSFSKSTATQLASDIRNAYRRESVKARLKGLRSDERWDAAWGVGEDGEYYIWLKYLGSR